MRSAYRNESKPSGRASGPSSGVLSVEKAFAILSTFFEDDSEVLALGELARRTALPKPTIHRLAVSLVEVGALERVDGGYRLGMRLFELGERVGPKRDLREAALPFIQDLYEATHHTVHLAVLDGTEVVYVERIRGHRPVKVPSSVGGRLPAYCTGVGKALLAHADSSIAALGERPLRARTPYTITVPAVLREELARIRLAGVAFDREESTRGVHCVAAPVFVDGEAVAALSVSGPVRELNIESVAIAVRTAANGLGRTLRGPSQVR